MPLQIRQRDGHDRRFYMPDRDLVYALPRSIRLALESFNEYKDPGGYDERKTATREDVINAAGALGQLTTAILDGNHPNKELSRAAIRHWLEENRPASTLICEALTTTLLGQLWAWAADARPKTKADADIPTFDLDEIEKFFAER